MSLRKAVNEFCKQCIYDKHQEGTWRQQVARCTSHGCPLWPVRPGTKSTQDEFDVNDTGSPYDLNDTANLRKRT